MSSRKQQKAHQKVVESWQKYEKVKEKRARGKMAGITEEVNNIPPPLSTQELIDLVEGTTTDFQPTKQSVKKAKVTPSPPVPPPIPTRSISVTRSASSTAANDVSPTKYRPESESPFYRLDPTNPAVGDIVSTTVSKVNHHFAQVGVVSPNYVLLGRVKHFVNVLKSTRPNHPVDEWEEERVGVEWLPIEVLTEKRDVILGPILPTKLTVVAKHDNPNFMGMNLFLSEHLNKHFYWDKYGGWKIVRNYLLEMEHQVMVQDV